MSRAQRVQAFIQLGDFINNAENEEIIYEWAALANSRNNWFTTVNVLKSLRAIASQFLNAKNLEAWVGSYPEIHNAKKVGVVMAGNIPAVGFHDAMSVLISGHNLLAKPSSEDTVPISALLNELTEIEPGFKTAIQFADRLNEADAYIATGSDNTARYFHYYFGKKPNIIRKNRTSVAVLTGDETHAELEALGRDVLQYFGLGCRNVSKLFVPAGYDFTKFYDLLQYVENDYLHHHKYFNNYEYNRSVFLVNREPHLDNGFLMIRENEALVSPISVLHTGTYQHIDELKTELSGLREKIQCIVARPDTGFENSVDFGGSQTPGLFDYADNVDTMQFLAELE
ncbi:acyl-CoA reductase [Dyadobacter luticola]|uniref:Acyl-CoA reductase n=1 Tax=Dyadobacter luticola TaxID=1979387 RepID=A0A5R9L655_9BACT|nr:acyl-CoA reductase [Dyadobacter luticola]